MEALLPEIQSMTRQIQTLTSPSKASELGQKTPGAVATLDGYVQQIKEVLKELRRLQGDEENGVGVDIERLLESFADFDADLARIKSEQKQDPTTMIINCSYMTHALLQTRLGILTGDIVHVPKQTFQDAIATILPRYPRAESGLHRWNDGRLQESLEFWGGGKYVLQNYVPEGITSVLPAIMDAWVLNILYIAQEIKNPTHSESDSSTPPQERTPRLILCQGREPPEIADQEKEKGRREGSKVHELDEVTILEDGNRTILRGITEYIQSVIVTDIKASWKSLEEAVLHNFDSDVDAKLVVIDVRYKHKGGLEAHLPQVAARCIGILNLPKFRTRSGISFVLTNGREWLLGVVDSTSGSKLSSASIDSADDPPYKIFVSPEFTVTHLSILDSPDSQTARKKPEGTPSASDEKAARQPGYEEFLRAVLIWVTSSSTTLLGDLSAYLDFAEITDAAARIKIQDGNRIHSEQSESPEN